MLRPVNENDVIEARGATQQAWLLLRGKRAYVRKGKNIKGLIESTAEMRPEMHFTFNRQARTPYAFKVIIRRHIQAHRKILTNIHMQTNRIY